MICPSMRFIAAGELGRTARLNENMGYSTYTGLRHIQAYKLVQPIENMLKRHTPPGVEGEKSNCAKHTLCVWSKDEEN